MEPTPEPMRVLFVHPLALKGGSENVLLRVLDGLDERYEPTVLLLQHGSLEAEIAERGVKVHVEQVPLGKHSVLSFPSAARRVERRLAEQRPAVIHANGTKAALFAAFLGPRLGAPVLWMKHGHDFERWAPRLVGSRCEHVICVSRAIAETFPARLQDRVSVGYPGVELTETFPARDTVPRIVSVGRLEPKKGITTLVRAVDELRDRGVDAQLDIIGPSDPHAPRYPNRLRRLIKKRKLGDRVTIRGWVDDLDAAYQEARVVALASRVLVPGRAAEGAPLTLLEGMSSARPVVGPDEPGISDVVGDAGTLVERVRAKPFADALAPYLEDPELASEVGARGRERVERSFTIDHLTRQLEQLYDELGGGTPAPIPPRPEGAAARIAVVIPCFNDGEFIGEALGSIREREPVEIVVVDDASDDEQTLEKLEELGGNGVRVIRHESNRGVSAARMTGVEATGAPYVLPLDADDMAVPGALAAMADRLDSDPDAALCFGDLLEFGDRNLIRAVPERLDRYRLAYTNEYPALTMIRREVLERTGGWTAAGTYEDWDFWMRLAEDGYSAVHMGPGVLTYKRRAHGGRLGGRLRTRHREVYRKLRDRHPKLFSDLRAARRESDLGPIRKLLYPVVYGGRPRASWEPRVKRMLDRLGVWTLRR